MLSASSAELPLPAGRCDSGGLAASMPACSVQAGGPTCCRLYQPQPLAVLHKVLHIPQTLHICQQIWQVQLGPCRWSGCLQPSGAQVISRRWSPPAVAGACTQTDKSPTAVGQRAHQYCSAQTWAELPAVWQPDRPQAASSGCIFLEESSPAHLSAAAGRVPQPSPGLSGRRPADILLPHAGRPAARGQLPAGEGRQALRRRIPAQHPVEEAVQVAQHLVPCCAAWGGARAVGCSRPQELPCLPAWLGRRVSTLHQGRNSCTQAEQGSTQGVAGLVPPLSGRAAKSAASQAECRPQA